MAYKKKICLQVILVLLIINYSVQAQDAYQKLIGKADSLFLAQNWASAKKIYEAVLNDTSHNALSWNRLGFSNYNLKLYDEALKNYEKAALLNPLPGIKPVLYSRLAKVYAIKKRNRDAYTALDSAVSNGYFLFKELDTLSDFQTIRNEERFKKLREEVYINANPCMADAHHREFDFWIGEWDVYQTGTKQPVVGHSLIQMISGGCAILEHWESSASNGKSINFIDPVTNKWKQSWAGNYANGTQEFVDGEYKDSAMRFTFETVNAPGQKLIGRFIFYNENSNQVRQFNEISADGGKTWTTSYDFTYIRKK